MKIPEWHLVILCTETNERICFLNVSPDEVIRSLFYNKNNDSLITVSVYASDNFSSLKCRSTRIECVKFHCLCLDCSISSIQRLYFSLADISSWNLLDTFEGASLMQVLHFLSLNRWSGLDLLSSMMLMGKF